MRLPRLWTVAQAVLVVVPLVTTAASPALAQLESREAIALRNEIYQLQQQVQNLQQQVARGGGGGTPTYLGRGGGYGQQDTGGNDLVAQLLARVDALEEQVRQLRGRIDETANQVDRQGAELGKRIDDLAFQMQNPGAAATQPIGPTTSPPPAVLGTTSPPPPPPSSAPSPPRTPEAAIQEGHSALARRDYRTAEADAREVLTKFRTSPRAYDAQFLLAQALAGQRQFPQAAIAYDDAYNRSRKGAHAQDALLGLATALSAINEKKAACDTLGKLRSEFPQPRGDVRDAAATLHQRAGCR